MNEPCSTFLVAEETFPGGTVRTVGCVHVDWPGKGVEEIREKKSLANAGAIEESASRAKVDAHFGMLCVPKEFGGRGIGALLVTSAGGNTSVLACKWMTLWRYVV